MNAGFATRFGLAFHAATLAASRMARSSLGWAKASPVTAETALSSTKRRSVQ